MNAMYEQGQIVQSRVDAQGLKRDALYRVIDATVRSTAFGGFVTYEVEPLDGGEHLAVGNGHLVLDPVPSESEMRERLAELQSKRAANIHSAMHCKQGGARYRRLRDENVAFAAACDKLIKLLALLPTGPVCEGCEQHDATAKPRSFGDHDHPVLCDGCYESTVQAEVESAERAAGWDPTP